MKSRAGRKRQTTLPLPLTRERAYTLTEEIPLSAVLSPDTGGYFWASFRRNGASRRIYVGAPVRAEEIVQAHAIVRAELEAEQAAVLTPALRTMMERHMTLLGEPPASLMQLKRTDPRSAANALRSLLVAPPRERQASR